MFQTSVIASGSKGNCFLVRTADTQILIDIGITFRAYGTAMEQLGLDPYKIDAVFISHEHSDHVGGVGVLNRKTAAPIYITQPTLIYSEKKMGNLRTEPNIFESGIKIMIKDLVILPFPSSHDAVDGCNFIIHTADDPKRKLAVVTDTGYATKLLKNHLSQVSTMILESNHDLQMLKTGPYEWYLKQRIQSRNGHLSNLQAAELVKEIHNEGHKRIILVHLSEINNTPELAYKEMKKTLDSLNTKIDLQVSGQFENTPLFDI